MQLYNTNRLTLLKSKVKSNGRNLVSEYSCSCGNIRYYTERQVLTGRIKSCGCLKKERVTNLKYKNGLKAKNLKLYQVWASMRKRCNKEKDNAYLSYGGRGIRVCLDWDNSFELFYNWSINNGYIESVGLSIDRIDNNGNYCPENCRWTNSRTQNENTSCSVGREKAELIKNDLKLGIYTNLQIAEKYKKSLSTIKRIKYKKTYL
jgi:hypothetical protein